MDHNELWKQLDKSEQRMLKTMSDDVNIARHLVESLFPTIFGNDEVKLGVLLMLFGGVQKHSPSEGVNLRGDINVCLVGDPSTAKSQILKYESSRIYMQFSCPGLWSSSVPEPCTRPGKRPVRRVSPRPS